MTQPPQADQAEPPVMLYSAVVRLSGKMDPAERQHSYVIAAPSRLAAEHRLMTYLQGLGEHLDGPAVLGEVLDGDIARVYGQKGGIYEPTLARGTDKDLPEL